MQTWTPDFISWQATWGRWLRSLVIAAVLTVAPALAAYVTAPSGSLLESAAKWYFGLIFGVGVIGGGILYVGLRKLAHSQLHRRVRSSATGRLERGCPWCDQERENRTLPPAIRDQRDRLRERLQRAEFRD
jgi:hypothetical protein